MAANHAFSQFRRLKVNPDEIASRHNVAYDGLRIHRRGSLLWSWRATAVALLGIRTTIAMRQILSFGLFRSCPFATSTAASLNRCLLTALVLNGLLRPAIREHAPGMTLLSAIGQQSSQTDGGHKLTRQ
jgi:hypothetical protein